MSNFVLTPNAVAKLRRAIAPRSGNTGAVAASGVPLDPDRFPPPFTVRWSAAANQNAGAWVIWLPGLGNLVALGGAFVSTVGGISAAQGLPSGWYTIDDLTANSTAVYLVVTVIDSTGAATAELSGTPGQATTGETVYNVKVADIATNAAGAKSVKQYVDSIVTIGGSGGGSAMSLDDISLDLNNGGEAQVKDWDTGTPASSTTIAQDIHDGNTTAQGTVVERTTGGVLQYKKPGTLAQLLGSSVSLSSQKVLTGLRWDTTDHTLVISSATVTVANGVITAWAANNDETILTTPISNLIN